MLLPRRPRHAAPHAAQANGDQASATGSLQSAQRRALTLNLGSGAIVTEHTLAQLGGKLIESTPETKAGERFYLGPYTLSPLRSQVRFAYDSVRVVERTTNTINGILSLDG